MNLEGGSFSRCVRHPSQFFTGFCSSCLVERLSNVDSVERSPAPPSSGPQSEMVEICSFSSVVDSQRKRNEVRTRKTLLSLFQLDDCNDAIVECESKAPTSGSGAAHVDKRVDSLEGKHLKDNNLSFWSSSVLPAKRLRWRSRGAPKSGRFEDKRQERNQELSFCNWRMCDESHESQESGKDAWEKPRHSWDGSMMSKALTCPFACLEEPQDGSSGIRMRLHEEHVATDTDRCNGTIDVSKGDNGNNGSSVDEEEPASSNGTLRNLFRERRREEFHQEINGKDVSRNKSQRWSRVWDWGITSPFRDFSKRKEHVYGRSLSETLQEANQDVSGPTSGILHASRTNQSSLNRNVHDGELQKSRPDWRRKGEYRFGRSRSVHYPSPGNVENGLLRFYLTPMRISRRSSNNRRMQTSWFFPKGILGD